MDNACFAGVNNYHPIRLPGILAIMALFVGCATSGDKRAQPFSDDWHDTQIREQAFQERRERIYGTEEEQEAREKRTTDLVRDAEGDHALGIRASEGVRADFGYDGGPKGGLKIDWDFARPERD